MASWAASEFALDHVTSAKRLTHLFGSNAQYYSLNQNPTREECPRKEPRELPFFLLSRMKGHWTMYENWICDTVRFDSHCMEVTCYTQACDRLQFSFVWGVQVGWYGWLFNTHVFNTHAFNTHAFLFRTAFLLLFNLRVIVHSSLPLGLLDLKSNLILCLSEAVFLGIILMCSCLLPQKSSAWVTKYFWKY